MTSRATSGAERITTYVTRWGNTSTSTNTLPPAIRCIPLIHRQPLQRALASPQAGASQARLATLRAGRRVAGDSTFRGLVRDADTRLHGRRASWRSAALRMKSQSPGERTISPWRSCSNSAPVAFSIAATTDRGRIMHPGLSTNHCRVSGSSRSHNLSMPITDSSTLCLSCGRPLEMAPRPSRMTPGCSSPRLPQGRVTGELIQGRRGPRCPLRILRRARRPRSREFPAT